jgi:hypothetical protein
MKRGEICNEYTREEFLGLDPKELKKMGIFGTDIQMLYTSYVY